MMLYADQNFITEKKRPMTQMMKPLNLKKNMEKGQCQTEIKIRPAPSNTIVKYVRHVKELKQLKAYEQAVIENS